MCVYGLYLNTHIYMFLFKKKYLRMYIKIYAISLKKDINT